VSLPLFQFLLFRWYYRLFIWSRFLWQVSRLKLNLVPTHPDGAAGLSFLADASYAFIPLLMAQGVLLSGALADRILYVGASLIHFKFDIIAVVVVVVLSVLSPLLVFTPQLLRVKRIGRWEYGALAQSYVRGFDQKWLRGGAPPDEPLIGSGDIQSLADLHSSYEIIQNMRPVVFDLKTILRLGIVPLAPVLPLVLTMIPLNEIMKRLIKIFL